MCDMNFFPIASCPIFSSSYNPLLLHPSLDVETAHHFSLTHSLAPVTQPHLQTSFTLAPSGSLRVTLLQYSPLHLAISPVVIQTCFHLSHLKKHVASWISVLFQLLPISLLVFMSNLLIQLPRVIFLQFCLDCLQAGSHLFHCIWLPSTSIPWLPTSTALVEEHQQNFLYWIDVHCFCSLSHTKWKSFSTTELLVCRWKEDTWFPREQVRVPVTWRTVRNRKYQHFYAYIVLKYRKMSWENVMVSEWLHTQYANLPYLWRYGISPQLYLTVSDKPPA